MRYFILTLIFVCEICSICSGQTLEAALKADSLSRSYSDRYLFSESIECLETAVPVYEELSYMRELADAKYRLGDMYCMKGQYHLTLGYTVDALRIYEAEKDAYNILKCYNSLAQIYYICEEYESSSRYLELFGEGAIMLQDTTLLIKMLNNKAVLAGANADTALTDRYITECLELTRSSGDEEVWLNVLMNLLPVALNVHNINDSIPTALYRLLNGAESIAERLDDINISGRYFSTIGLCHYMTGEYSKAAEEYNKAVGYFSKGEFELYLNECYTRLHHIYMHLGNMENAYSSLLKAHSIDSAMGTKNMYISLFKYENELMLSHQLELLAHKKNRQNVLLMSAILVLLLLTILAIIYFYRRAIRIQAKEASLNNRNDIIKLKELQQSKMDSMMQETVSRLTRMSYHFNDEALHKEIAAVCSDLKEAISTENWKEIDQFVPEFNSTFFVKLLKDFPDLSLNERRLCVLLNMNLTTKQIAEITKQSPHSIDIARFRLRNKLGINDRTVSLQAFLSKYNH